MKDEATGSEGLQLPGLLGAAGKVANSGPVKALLGPALAVFGKYYGERAEEIVARWRKTREENLEIHREAVIAVIGRPVEREPSEKQLNFVNDWIEGAQEIPPQEEEISAIWQSLLAAIYKNDEDVKYLLDTVKQLDSGDARFILRFDAKQAKPRGLALRRFQKLTNLCILERVNLLNAVLFSDISVRERMLRLYFWLFLPCCVILFILPLSYRLLTAFSGFDFENSRAQIFVEAFKLILLLCTIVTASLLAIPISRRFGSYLLTDFGSQIQASARRFLKRSRLE